MDILTILILVAGFIVGVLLQTPKAKKFYRDILKLYNEDEVKDMFEKLQYEMAQQIIGNRGKDKIIPLEFFEENKKK
jgi:hypothetical protein